MFVLKLVIFLDSYGSAGSIQSLHMALCQPFKILGLLNGWNADPCVIQMFSPVICVSLPVHNPTVHTL